MSFAARLRGLSAVKEAQHATGDRAGHPGLILGCVPQSNMDTCPSAAGAPVCSLSLGIPNKLFQELDRNEVNRHAGSDFTYHM